jgi:hypothetical protein
VTPCPNRWPTPPVSISTRALAARTCSTATPRIQKHAFLQLEGHGKYSSIFKVPQQMFMVCLNRKKLVSNVCSLCRHYTKELEMPVFVLEKMTTRKLKKDSYQNNIRWNLKKNNIRWNLESVTSHKPSSICLEHWFVAVSIIHNLFINILITTSSVHIDFSFIYFCTSVSSSMIYTFVHSSGFGDSGDSGFVPELHYQGQ